MAARKRGASVSDARTAARFDAREAIKGQVQSLVDVVRLDGLPDDKYEALEVLRFCAKSEDWIPEDCPECGRNLENIDPEAHAEAHWPSMMDLDPQVNSDAIDRRDALLRAAEARERRR